MKSFKELIQTEENTALIVDALNLAFRYKHSGQEDFAEDYVNTVASLASSYKASKIIIAADKGSSAYRLKLHPEYKLTRRQAFEAQSEEEKESFRNFFTEFERALAICAKKYCVLRFDKVEADDIAAYIAGNKSAFSIDKIWLISSDKDWNLLVSPTVSQFSTVTRQEITIENFEEIRGVAHPDQYLSMKVLMGEMGKSSDNVPGISQVGIARAKALVLQYGSAFDVYASLPLPGNYAFIKNVNSSEDLILLNYKLFDLVTYSEEAIGKSNIQELQKLWKDYTNEKHK